MRQQSGSHEPQSAVEEIPFLPRVTGVRRQDTPDRIGLQHLHGQSQRREFGQQPLNNRAFPEAGSPVSQMANGVLFMDTGKESARSTGIRRNPFAGSSTFPTAGRTVPPSGNTGAPPPDQTVVRPGHSRRIGKWFAPRPLTTSGYQSGLANTKPRKAKNGAVVSSTPWS